MQGRRARGPRADRLKFQTLNGHGFKSNYFELASRDHDWISGCRRDGADRLYGERIPVEIDEDVREEYWAVSRRRPGRKARKVA